MPTTRPVQIYDFTAFSRRTPTQQPPGDRLDAQFRVHADAIAGIQQALDRLRAQTQATPAPREPTLPTPALYVNAGGPYATTDAGATATSADYAQVAIEWAEHMPDTVPGNVLAINAISGDHWSSRWWANKCANLVSALMQGGAGVRAELVTVTGLNTFASLAYAPIDGATTMQMIVNGRVFSGCATPPPFTVNGAQVTWASTLFLVDPTDEVVARYRYAVTLSASSAVHTMTLYYVATQGQTNFALDAVDRFTRSYVLKTSSSVHVNRNGARLMPLDGSGNGGFSVSGNSVILAYPAGLGETIVVDVGEPASG